MTKVSKRWLDKRLEEYIFELFVKAIVDLKTSEEVKNFIEDILYPSEKIMLIKRLAIAVLLSKGFTYEAIDDTLKVNATTINRVSYWLRHGSKGYQKAVQKIIDSQEREELGDKIEDLLLKLSPPKAIGSMGFEQKSKRGKELVKRELRRNFI